MIAHSIKAAMAANCFDQIVVTTDDDKIAKIAISYGASVPFRRPAELADDFTTTVPVIKHAIGWMNQHVGAVGEVCCLYPTAPFVQPSSIIEAYRMLSEKPDMGYVFSATSFPFPIQRAFQIKDGGYVEMFQPDMYTARSQDLVPAFQDAGQFYWGRSELFLNDEIFFSSRSRAYLLPRHLVQDIDTLEDWRRAEFMYEALRSAGEL